MLLMIVQAIIVNIIGLVCGSVIIQTANITTKKFRNKEIKDRAPFLPPITIIKTNKMMASKSKTFIISPSFDQRKILIYINQSGWLRQCRFPRAEHALIPMTDSLIK